MLLNMRRRRLLGLLIGYAATIGLVVTAMTAPAGVAAADPASAAKKIKPELVNALRADATTDFWIRFQAKADLTEASRTADWSERGTAVAAALRETAAESQSAVLAELNGLRLSYETFWASNAIRVSGGSMDVMEGLAAHTEVEGLYAPVAYGEPEVTSGQTAEAADSLAWGVANINADDVWSQFGDTGAGIVVAGIDTGAQYDHPALVNQYRGNNGDGTFDHDYNWYDAAGGSSKAPFDSSSSGHGTHTMGTMVGDDGAGNQIGVAPGVTWIAANGCCPSDAALIRAGQWMLEPTDLAGQNPDASKRPNIINNSWGSTNPSNSPFMEDVTNAWTASGIFGVFSNGNSGGLGCDSSGSPGSLVSNYSTGAHGIDDTIADFSGRGAGQDGELKPNISAPGVGIRSSVPGGDYASLNGTSMAAPHLAGAVALLWAGAPALRGDVEATRALLDDTAIDTAAGQCGGTADDNNVFGEGRLDALALLNAAPDNGIGTLTGTVTDAATGEPIQGAKVTIAGQDGWDLSTGADGTYQARLAAGRYTVVAARFAYAQVTAEVSVTAEQTTVQDLAMTKQPTASVSGRILDASGHGWPLYAEVSVPEAGASTYTDPVTGDYSIELPVGATYTLKVASQYDGYLSVERAVEVDGSGRRVDFEVPVDVDSCIAAGYEYTFHEPVLSEDFDAGVLPAGWTLADNVGNGQVWSFDDPGKRGNLTGGGGGFAVVDSWYHPHEDAQNTDLITPAMDLSEVPLPIVDFRQDFLWLLEQLAEVDVSVDGGQSWSNVWRQTTDRRGPNLQTLRLPAAANQANVKLRFHYAAPADAFWWQLDDVVVRNRTCDPVPGGMVVGTVYDHNTAEPVNGATVTSVDAPGESATTEATPGDESRPDGFYRMFSSLTGRHPFETSATAYTAARENAATVPDRTIERDFSLKAGELSVEPANVSTTIELGDRSAQRTFTVTNTGSAPAEVAFGEHEGSFEMLRADGVSAETGEQTTTGGAPLQRFDVPVSLGAVAAPTMSSQDSPAAGPAGTAWTNIADYPRAVMDNRVVRLDGKTYSIAGSDGMSPTGASFVYDPATLAWEPIAALPKTRATMTVGVIDGKIVASSGWGNVWVEPDPQGDTWIYDPALDHWSEAADNPTPRAAAAQAVLDGKLYSVGGCTTVDCLPVSNDVLAYDLADNSWKAMADYPLAVAYASCGAIGGRIHCTGGHDGTAETANGYAYDPGTDSWSKIATAPVTSWANAYAVANDLLVVSSGVQDGMITNAVIAYDPAGNEWIQLANANTATYRGAAACGLYKIGGATIGFEPTPVGEVLPGYTDCGDDVPWMTTDVTSTRLDPGESVKVTLTLSADVDQPGGYTAGVSIREDTPYSYAPVGVTMNVTPPKTWGRLVGTVTGVACDSTGGPLVGATVQVDSWAMDWTLRTDANGAYAQWIDRRNNPLAIIVAKDGYKPKSATAKIKAGHTVTADFALAKTGC